MVVHGSSGEILDTKTLMKFYLSFCFLKYDPYKLHFAMFETCYWLTGTFRKWLLFALGDAKSFLFGARMFGIFQLMAGGFNTIKG